jgi:hypothetical protein
MTTPQPTEKLEETQLSRVVRRAEQGDFGDDTLVIRISACGHSLSRFGDLGGIKKLLKEMTKYAEEYEKVFQVLKENKNGKKLLNQKKGK